jgi:hypothetical protein
VGNNATDPLIFPMAHYIGEQYDSESQSSVYTLRGGWTVVELNAAERLVWAHAHGMPEQLQQGTRWTREALLEAVKPQVGEDAHQIIEHLLEEDVLIEVQPGSKAAIEFAKEVRLVPLRLGLGNSAEEPGIWRIGSDVDSPMIGVSQTVYSNWAWAHLYKNLWDSCQSMAKLRATAEDAASATESDSDPEIILYEVLERSHLLLASASAYFDVPFDWGTV